MSCATCRGRRQNCGAIPPFEFENWAVIALGGTPNVAQVGDMGIDGRIYPVSAVPKKADGELGFMDVWYPIQVKQKDKVGRPDIDAFEAVMARNDRTQGFFVAFDYSQDAYSEIQAFMKKTRQDDSPHNGQRYLRRAARPQAGVVH